MDKKFPLCEGKDRLSCPISKVKGTSPEIIGVITLEKLFDDMLTDEVDAIEKSNALTEAYKNDTPQYERLKSQLDGFIVGQFSKREDTACEVSAPLLIFDIDKIENELVVSQMLFELQQNPHIFAAFPSCGGHGLRVIVWSETTFETRKKVYEAFAIYLAEWLNIETDKQLRKRLKSEGKNDDHTIVRVDTATSNISRHWYYKSLTSDKFYQNLESKVFCLEQKTQNAQQVYLASQNNVSPQLTESETIDACVKIV